MNGDNVVSCFGVVVVVVDVDVAVDSDGDVVDVAGAANVKS